jgi:hypothetical protein
MPFQNSIVGGAGALVRALIKSPNFVTGVSGWIIRRDGSAEFNNLTLRGTFFGVNYEISSLGAFFYSGVPATGNLIISVASAGGADDGHGNPFFQGVTVYDPGIGTAAQLLSAALVFSSTGFSYASPADVTTDATGGQLILNSSSNGVNTGTEIALGDTTVTIQKQAGAPGSTTLLDVEGKAFVNGIIELANHLLLDAHAAPGTPAASKAAFYLSSVDGFLHCKFTSGNDVIVATDDTWHTLGALGAHYTVVLGRYKLSDNGLFLELDIQVNGDGLQANSVTFANTLPLAYRPATSHVKLPMGTGRAVTAGDTWPILDVTSAGAVTVTNAGTAHTYAFSGRIPLD